MLFLEFFDDFVDCGGKRCDGLGARNVVLEPDGGVLLRVNNGIAGYEAVPEYQTYLLVNAKSRVPAVEFRIIGSILRINLSNTVLVIHLVKLVF